MIHLKQCHGRSFTPVGDWWVCSSCRKPYPMYLEKRMSQDNIVLHFFRGGPRDGQVWSLDQMLYQNDELTEVSWITDYRWTSETVTGSESGRIARVWEYRDSK